MRSGESYCQESSSPLQQQQQQRKPQAAGSSSTRALTAIPTSAATIEASSSVSSNDHHIVSVASQSLPTTPTSSSTSSFSLRRRTPPLRDFNHHSAGLSPHPSAALPSSPSRKRSTSDGDLSNTNPSSHTVPKMFGAHNNSDPQQPQTLEDLSEEFKYPAILCGLNNIGNTCYFNAGLQCLVNVGPFVSAIRHCGNVKKLHRERNSMLRRPIGASALDFYSSFVYTLQEMDRASEVCLTPGNLLKQLASINPQFEGLQQQDSPEMVYTAISAIEDATALHMRTAQVLKQCGLSTASAVAEEEDLVLSSSSSSSISTSTSGPTAAPTAGGGNNNNPSSCAAKYRHDPKAVPTSFIADQSSLVIQAIRDIGAVRSAQLLQFMTNVNTENAKLEKQGSYVPPQLFRSGPHDVFKGYLLNETQCSSCHYVSRIVDSFTSLNLALPTYKQRIAYAKAHEVAVGGVDAASKKKAPGGATWNPLVHIARCFMAVFRACGCMDDSGSEELGFLSLEECLAIHFEETNLQRSNRYHCEVCNKKVDAVHRSTVLDLPEVLVIQLKRFEFGQYWTTKKGDHVEFPMDWSEQNLSTTPVGGRSGSFPPLQSADPFHQTANSRASTAASPRPSSASAGLLNVPTAGAVPTEASPLHEKVFSDPASSCGGSLGGGVGNFGENETTTSSSNLRSDMLMGGKASSSSSSSGVVGGGGGRSNSYDNNSKSKDTCFTTYLLQARSRKKAMLNRMFPDGVLDLEHVCSRLPGSLPLPEVSTYTLNSIINHHGSFNGGHYTSFVNKPGAGWLLCNDHRVSRVSRKEVQKSQAYLMVYQKQKLAVEDQSLLDLRRLAMEYLAEARTPTTSPQGSGSSEGQKREEGPRPQEEGVHYISRLWLHKLATYTEPGLILNAMCYCDGGDGGEDKRCYHRQQDQVPLTAVSADSGGRHFHCSAEWFYVAVTAVDWRNFQAEFGGGPAVKEHDFSELISKEKRWLNALMAYQGGAGASSAMNGTGSKKVN